MAELRLPIEGMTCQHCVRTLTQTLESTPGVESALVRLDRREALVRFDSTVADRAALVAAVERAGYRVATGQASQPVLVQLGAPSAAASARQPRLPSSWTEFRSPDGNAETRRPEFSAPPENPAEPSTPGARDVRLAIEGMHCASCVTRVEQALLKTPGVRSARVNLATEEARVHLDAGPTTVPQLVEAIERSGYRARPIDDRAEPFTAVSGAAATEQKSLRRRLLVGATLTLPLVIGHFAGWPALAHGWPALVLATILQGYVGWPFYVGAWQRLRHFSANMDTLVALGTTAAWGAGAAEFLLHRAGSAPHEAAYGMPLMDAGMILTFITLGKLLEARAKHRASSAIQRLLDLAPREAQVIRDGQPRRVPIADIGVGETLLVPAGEKMPLDGKVLDGHSSLDESWLTGESMPVDKKPGDEVFSGTLNVGSGGLTVEVTRPAGQTALAQVVELVRAAQESKPEVQRLADRVVAWFVPLVLSVAVLTLGAWGLAAGDWLHGISAAVAVLVVACPCALGLATPTAVLVASGRGAESGILIKDARSLEIAPRLTTIVLDKTGTITLGKPRVTELLPAAGTSEAELLQAAASIERLSSHPIAAAIVAAAAERGSDAPPAQQAEVVPGAGMRATIDDQAAGVGNERLLEILRIERGELFSPLARDAQRLRSAGQTPLFVARGSRVLGLIAAADVVAPHSRAGVRRLEQLGLDVHLLTGDHRATAEQIAAQVGIRQVTAEVLPDGKAAEVRRLREAGHCVAMVGDGINDAPALASADLGIAIGSGADVAIETADIVLVGTDLRLVARSILLSRAALRTIRQNLAWAFGYNVILIPLAAGVFWPLLGWSLPPIAAAAAMALSSVSVVANSLLLRVRTID